MPVVAPLVGTAISGIGGWLANRKSKAQKQAEAMQQGAIQNLSGLGKQANQMGGEQYNLGGPAVSSAMNYYSTLLHGNRAAQSQAVAAPYAAVTDVYRGAQRGLDRTMARGGAKDLANSELNRDRASKLAGIVTGVQPMAAGALGAMGNEALNRSTNFMNLAGSDYGAAATGAGNIVEQQMKQKAASNSIWGSVGKSIYGIWGPKFNDMASNWWQNRQNANSEHNIPQYGFGAGLGTSVPGMPW